MSLSISKNSPEDWYLSDVSFSIELMKTYIQSVETQAKESVERYEEGKVYITQGASSSEEIAEIELYQGIDDSTWDLDNIFKEYFPSLLRSSGIVTLYTFLEDQLNRLCSIYEIHLELGVRCKDLRGSGIIRSVSYLEKIIGINVNKNTQQWSEITRIQILRNIIVHTGGRISDIDERKKQKIQIYLRDNEFLDGEREIIVNEGYLMHLLNTVDAYFLIIGAEIKKTS